MGWHKKGGPLRETVNEKAISLFDFTPSLCFDASLCSKAPRWACLLLFRQAIKRLGNKSNHFFFPWTRSQRIQNSTGQMLNQDVSTFLNTLLVAKAKWFARASIPESSFSPGIFSHPLSPPSAPPSCVLATRVRMFRGILTWTHPSALILALPEPSSYLSTPVISKLSLTPALLHWLSPYTPWHWSTGLSSSSLLTFKVMHSPKSPFRPM